MITAYVDNDGKYLLSSDGEAPEGAIAVDPPPEYADQVWSFPGWGESAIKAAAIETAWRNDQMPKAQQNVTALEYGEESIPGTAQQWQKYWLALRKWTDANPDFPDSSKRPVAPS